MADVWSWFKNLFEKPQPVVVEKAKPVKPTPAKKPVRTAAVTVKKAATKTATRLTKKRK